MKKIFVVFSLVLLWQVSYAQAVPALLIPSDTRSMAMGGVTMQTDADKLDVQAFYGMWAPKTADNTMIGGNAFIRFGEKLGVSLEGRVFKDKPYEVITSQALSGGTTFSPMDMIVGAGASYSLTKAFTIGAKARMVQSAIAADAKGSTFCGDVSFTYSRDFYSATIAMRNLGGRISYGGAGYTLPALAALQGEVKPVEGLTAAAEVDLLFAGCAMGSLGLEYGIADIVFLRGGLHYCNSSKGIPTYASLGLGVQFAGVHLDAAFLTASKTLGNSLMFTLGYAF
ncbi:MAG: PorV/PorQ family protein [Bacteroidales bacterium]|nr:PorV/PorQ family protein [Bacteroidales bacterium]